MFSHSSNPLLTMCLTYEMLLNIIKKFFSLNNDCRMIMKHIMGAVKPKTRNFHAEQFPW